MMKVSVELQDGPLYDALHRLLPAIEGTTGERTTPHTSPKSGGTFNPMKPKHWPVSGGDARCGHAP